MKKVSIIIPCFNAERHVKAALDSALGQSWTEKEVIAVDDGSRDGTWEILHSYRPRIKVLTQANAGPGAARNAGLAAASGDYIQYMDADDLMDSDKIRLQMERLASLGPGAIAYGNWSHFRQEDARDAYFQEFDRYRDYAHPMDMLVSMWKLDWCLSIHCWLIPREVATKAGPWNPTVTIHDDFDYFARILCACDYAAYCPDARVYYRKGVGSSLTSRPVTAETARSVFEGLRTQAAVALAREDSPRVRQALARKTYAYIYDLGGLSEPLERQAWEQARKLGIPPPVMGGRGMRLLMPAIGFTNAVRLRRLFWRLKRAVGGI